VQSGNDCAIRIRKGPVTVGLNRYIVAQNDGKTVEVAFFVGHGDHPPVSESGGNTGYEGRGGLIIGVSGSGRDNAGRCD